LMSKLVEDLDYYIDEQSGLFVLTTYFLLNRGSCCGKGCKHCPYEPNAQKGNTTLIKK